MDTFVDMQTYVSVFINKKKKAKEKCQQEYDDSNAQKGSRRFRKKMRKLLKFTAKYCGRRKKAYLCSDFLKACHEKKFQQADIQTGSINLTTENCRTMINEKVGENAGLVWNALNTNEEGMSLKDIKKATKIKKNEEIFMAIGWLLREDKLNAVENEEDVIYSLK